MSLLTADHLVKKYRSKTVLDCSLELPAGKVIALVGPNGAGKSTLLNIATGLVRPTSGRVELFDGVVPGSHEALSRVAFVAQDAALPHGLTVASALSLTEALNERFDREYALERLEQLRIDSAHKVSNLSGGQRAQVSLTLALARKPDALVLDEPTAALDPLARHDFLASLVSAIASRTLSVVFSSHSIEELESVSDHLALLVGGHLALNESVESVVDRHAIVFAPLPTLQKTPSLHVIDADLSATTGHHLIRFDSPEARSDWQTQPTTLHRIVLGYLRNGATVPTRALEAVR